MVPKAQFSILVISLQKMDNRSIMEDCIIIKYFILIANYQDTWRCISTIDSEGSSQTPPTNNTVGPHPPSHSSAFGSLVASGLSLGGLTNSHFKDKTGWLVH